jgi:hypothetical protein
VDWQASVCWPAGAGNSAANLGEEWGIVIAGTVISPSPTDSSSAVLQFSYGRVAHARSFRSI